MLERRLLRDTLNFNKATCFLIFNLYATIFFDSYQANVNDVAQ